ncbi:cyclopropane fatty acyl phospholipid synthase [Pedobacter sp.]|uniref:cyclopropane fatty acyl phospholipid synthase n=1 Tax=Pedobacter sp. TaxID=1411316 RepID=UPI003D7FB446
MDIPITSSYNDNFQQRFIRKHLELADIKVNGTNPGDIQVNDDRFYKIVFQNGSLGLGESYTAGLWDCISPDIALYKLLIANISPYKHQSIKILWHKIVGWLVNEQSIKRALQNIHKHYDLGNKLFEAMLDKRMIYSCAYWKDANTLEEAQDNKLDLICRKLKLEEGQRILDIGCGWGGFAAFAAQKYGVEVVGVTLSKEQAQLAKIKYAHLPVEFHLQDYRKIRGQFDRIVSIGMMEHVGYKNYKQFMQVVNDALKDNGLFLLHTIGSDISTKRTDPWIHRYIFPNGMMPSLNQITKAAEGLFVTEDWHNFGSFYDPTLMEWRTRFKKSWPELRQDYDETFYRMWDYYLCCSAASFRAKKNHLWQFVYSKPGNQNLYIPVR